MQNQKLWQGRQTGAVDPILLEMGESISLDQFLFREDIVGSIAHAKMLEKIGILDKEESHKIQQGLLTVLKEISDGRMNFRKELEDIHSHVENRLVELIGDTGKKLHTARSRNDQVALDTHLYVRKQSCLIAIGLIGLLNTLLVRAKESVEVVLPGYTHMQIAQPIRLSHHLLSHFWTFLRDIDRSIFAFSQAGFLPLGSGALAGVNYATDREFLRQELKFEYVHPNSMTAVSSRDHILNMLFAVSQIAIHSSRLAEEVILWNTIEFSFIELPDSLTTGSSIMPQKKNPDLAELIRGKTGRIVSHLSNLQMNVKGLPLTYNRDLQEDRLPLIDSAKEILNVIAGLNSLYASMSFQKENMIRSLSRGFATATDLADALVTERKIPFRESHHIVGSLVAKCVGLGHTLESIPQKDRSDVHISLTDDSFYFQAVQLEASAEKKISYGGTSKARQMEQLEEAQKSLTEIKKRVADCIDRIPAALKDGHSWTI